MFAEQELCRAVAALEFDRHAETLHLLDVCTGHVARRASERAARADELLTCAEHGALLSECGCAS